MDEDQRDDKLYELSELHKNWLQSEAARNSQEQTDIFMVIRLIPGSFKMICGRDGKHFKFFICLLGM